MAESASRSESARDPRVETRGSNKAYPKEVVEEQLTKVLTENDLGSDSGILTLITIPEILYRGGNKKPQLFYWLLDFKKVMAARIGEARAETIKNAIESKLTSI